MGKPTTKTIGKNNPHTIYCEGHLTLSEFNALLWLDGWEGLPLNKHQMKHEHWSKTGRRVSPTTEGSVKITVTRW